MELWKKKKKKKTQTKNWIKWLNIFIVTGLDFEIKLSDALHKLLLSRLNVDYF